MIELQLLRISFRYHLPPGSKTTFHLRILFEFSILENPRPELLHTNLSISPMVEPSTLIPNLNEIMEEHAQLEGEVHLEPTKEVHLEPTEEVHLETTEENRPSEQQEVQPVVRQQKRKGKEKRH